MLFTNSLGFMIERSVIFFVVYFLLSAIYSILGFYTLPLNQKDKKNQIFFFMCVSLAIWSICLALMLVSANASLAMSYYKFSIFNCSIFYSLIFHFFYLLNHPNKNYTKRFYIVVYLPALMNIIFHALVIKFNMFSMKMSLIGYIGCYKNIFNTICGNLFGYLFSIATLVQIYQWYKNSNDKKNITLKKIVFYLFVVTAFGAFFLNFIVDLGVKFKGISFISIFIISPILIMFYIFMKNKVMHPKLNSENEDVLDETGMIKLFQIRGYVSLFIFYVLIVYNYQFNSQQITTHIIGIIMCYSLAVISFLLGGILKNKKKQYNFIIISSFFVLIFTSYLYIHRGNVTAWGIFFYYLVITAIFEKKIYTYVLSVFIILLQIFSWFYQKDILVHITCGDYVLRIILVVVYTTMVFFVNRLYRRKIYESNRNSEIHKTITNILSQIVKTPAIDIEYNLNVHLANLNTVFRCHKSYVCRTDDNAYMFSSCKNWLLKDTEDYIKTYNLVTNNILDINNIKSPEPFYVANYNLLDLDEKSVNYFETSGVLGYYVLPIVIESKIKYILIFEFKNQNAITYLDFNNKIIFNLAAIIIEKINREQKLLQQANYDEITGLTNRYRLETIVNSSISSNVNSKNSMICINISNFREINAAFGYYIGDVLLKTVANILKEKIGDTHTVARFGGDEYIIYLNNYYDKKNIIEIIEFIFEIFDKSFEIDIYKYKININAGIARSPCDGNNFDDLIKNAHLALNQAKKTGKMKYHFCTEKDKNLTLEKAIYTSKLVNCIENNELVLAFQPQMSFKTNKIIGAEVLIRWNSKDFGMVQPNKFIPILEDTGMIIKIGEWIIEESIKQQIKLINQGFDKLRISVNVSAIQFQDKLLIHKIKTMLNKNNIDSKYFEFEITETVAADDHDLFVKNFAAIKNIGCSIALDDFGVDYSSLSRLQELPIDRLKIDKLFVDGIGVNSKQEEIIKIILDLSVTLGLKSIAEGVETKEQSEFLRNLNCSELQGYYYSKPLFAKEFEEFVKDNI